MKGLILSVFADITWDITLLDGEIVHVKKPTQKQLIALDQKVNAFDKTTTGKLDGLLEITSMILSNNSDGRQITVDMLDGLTTDMLYAIYQGYQKFIAEIQTNPN